MLIRQLLPVTTLALLTVTTPYAQDSCSAAETSTRPRRVQATGILTDRLSKRNLQKWQAIERIVMATDAQGQPLHPTLRGLYEWAETSGHAIYVEMPSPQRAATCTAGSFMLEHFDPRGERHVGVLKLYLNNIDSAYVGTKVARENGFVPFDGLKREWRYAEVLGHELAHAAYILTNRSRAALVEELVENTNEMLLTQARSTLLRPLGQELWQRLTQRDELLKELEDQAESMEEAVWRELSAAQRER